MRNKILCTLTLKCNNDCLNCFIPTQVRKSGKQIEANQLLSVLDGIGIGQDDVIEISGGEPTIYSNISYLLSKVKHRYPGRLVLVSNAEVCSKKRSAEDISLSIDEIITNVYSVKKTIHDTITQTEGSLKRKLQGLENLSQLGVDISLKIVPMLATYKGMSEMVNEVGRRIGKGKRIIIKVLDLNGITKNNQKRLSVKLSEAAPYLEEAIETAKPIFSEIEINFPLCLLKLKTQRNYKEEPDKTVLISPNKGTKIFLRKTPNQMQICIGCLMQEKCRWFRKNYIDLFGENEFCRITEIKQV